MLMGRPERYQQKIGKNKLVREFIGEIVRTFGTVWDLELMAG